MCQAAQPLAAIAASRYALGAEMACSAWGWAPIRQPGRGLALRARHQRRRRCTPERPHVLPRLRTLSPGDGGDVKDVVRFALLETLGATRASRSCRGRGWGGVVQRSSCTSVRGDACVLQQHVQRESARRASATGAPYPQARPTPRTLT